MKYYIPLDMFRRLNPKLMERYKVFFLEQLKQKREDISVSGWTNGVYFGRAIGGCFSKEKTYPDEPLSLWSNDMEAEERQEKVSDAERFAGFAASFNMNFHE